jgi:hypothetical protein
MARALAVLVERRIGIDPPRDRIDHRDARSRVEGERALGHAPRRPRRDRHSAVLAASGRASWPGIVGERQAVRYLHVARPEITRPYTRSAIAASPSWNVARWQRRIIWPCDATNARSLGDTAHAAASTTGESLAESDVRTHQWRASPSRQ